MPPAHSHVVCMHSYCWSSWTSSISYCWTCLPFQLRRPAAFPIHSKRGTVLVLYWVCSDGLCACVCSVSLRGFRAVRATRLRCAARGEPRLHLVAFCARVHLRPVTPLRRTTFCRSFRSFRAYRFALPARRMSSSRFCGVICMVIILLTQSAATYGCARAQ